VLDRRHGTCSLPSGHLDHTRLQVRITEKLGVNQRLAVTAFGKVGPELAGERRAELRGPDFAATGRDDLLRFGITSEGLRTLQGAFLKPKDGLVGD
jgi:hypothetical protein